AAISLLSAEAPTRFRELNARSGEPRCSTEAKKPSAITTQRKNRLRTMRNLIASSFSLNQAKPLTINAPATHCPKTVKITSGHSCHPLPISHLLRVCQIAGGVTRRTAVGVRFNHNTRLREVRGRQRCHRSKLAVFFTQFIYRAKVQRPQ